MNLDLLPAAHARGVSAVRDRCGRLGLRTLLIDTDGTPEVMPVDPEGARALELVRGLTAGWFDHDKPAATRIDGCYLIPVPVDQRRTRRGYIVALSGPGGMCQNPEHAAGLSADLRDSLLSAIAHAEADEAVEGFTDQLSESYETLSLLYRLEAGNTVMARPASSVDHALDQLLEVLPLGWVCIDVLDAGSARLLEKSFALRCARPDQCPPARLIKDSIDRCGVPKLTRIREIEGIPAHNGASNNEIALMPIPSAKGVVGVLGFGDKHGPDPWISSYDTQLAEAVARHIGGVLDIARMAAEQEATFIGTLGALTSAIDAKDRYTRGHSERVAALARALAVQCGETDLRADRVHVAGLVHDVGKIGVPEMILRKPGKLDDAEFDAIKLHPRIGYDILKGIPSMEDVLPGVLSHHERWDGRGYPEGLAGEDIPLIARYLCLADTFDAMSSNRAYRPGMSREKVLGEIERCAGSQFDPKLAHAFLALDLTFFDDMLAQHKLDRVDTQDKAEITPKAA